jgi:hypothetical protein
VPHLEGEVNVDELLITRELSTAGHEGSPTAIEIALPPPTTTFDLRIRAPQKVRLQTRDARLELQGEVFASYDDDGLRLFGEVQTIRGYYWLYNHRFEVRRGIFTFRDVSDVENAGLDVLADTHIRGEKIEITLTGTLREPVVTATSESGWDETSIFRTLTFGGPGDTEESERGFTSGFVEAWRGALLDRIGARVAQDLGVDEIRLRADPGRGAEPQLEVGKRWADVYLSFRTAFGENSGTEALPSWELRDPERALSVEYRVSDRWSVDGEAGTLQGTEYVNVDLKFKLSY